MGFLIWVLKETNVKIISSYKRENMLRPIFRGKKISLLWMEWINSIFPVNWFENSIYLNERDTFFSKKETVSKQKNQLYFKIHLGVKKKKMTWFVHKWHVNIFLQSSLTFRPHQWMRGCVFEAERQKVLSSNPVVPVA